MSRLIIFSALVVGGYYVYKRGQERIAQCCPPGVMQGVCLMALDPSFFNTIKLGFQGGPVTNPICQVQRAISEQF